MDMKKITIGVLSATSIGHVAYDQYDTKKTREYVVKKDPTSFSAMSQKSLREKALTLGDITYDGEYSIRVNMNKKEAESLKGPGIVVEEVIKFKAIEPVKAKTTYRLNSWCSGPTPVPNPDPPPPPPPPPDPNAEKIDWGINRVSSVLAFNKGIQAKNVYVCVLDTGIDFEHPDVKFLLGRNFTYTIGNGTPSDFHDGNGHGTHVAGLIAATYNNGLGVTGSSQAQLLIAKVLDDDGYGDSDRIAAAIRWSVIQGCDVISMSLGSEQKSDAIEVELNLAARNNVKVIVAAGNENTSTPSYPAGYVIPGTVYSVAATDKADKRAWFSNFGKVEMACPGVDIYSTVPGGYDTMSGTSMATPICAGLMALYLSTGREPVYENIGEELYFGKGLLTAKGLLQ